MSVSDQAPPKTAEGSPAKAETKRPADDQVSTHNEGDHSPPTVTKDDQKPADQVDGGADEAGNEEESEHARSFWAQLKQDPFAVILAIATAGIFLATVALVVATIGVWHSTNGLVFATTKLVDTTGQLVTATNELVGTTDRLVTATDHLVSTTGQLVTATEGLRTATDRIADYAKEQGDDIKASMRITQQAADASTKSADAATKMADATFTVAQSSGRQVKVQEESLEVQKTQARENLSKERARIAILEITIPGFVGVIAGPGALGSNEPVEGLIKIRNTGQTRAEKITGWARAAMNPKSAKFVRGGQIIRFPDLLLETDIDETGSVKLQIRPEDRSKIFDNRAVLYVYGQIIYTDVLESHPYYKKFQFMSDKLPTPGESILRFVRAPEGNDEAE